MINLMFHDDWEIYGDGTGDDRFFTCFYGILDTEHHTFTYCNAGHDYPILISSSNGVERLQTGDLILGMFDEYCYNERAVKLKAGSLLVLYSDGVTEARNGTEYEFGEDRLLQLITKHRDAPAGVLIKHIVSAIYEFTGNAPQQDDITLIVLKRS